MARSRSCRSATSRSVSTPRGTCPSTTPTMPRPRGVTATKMSTGLAVAQWIVQTSGTALTGLRMLTGNPSRKKITKQCPAAMASALRVASSTNSGSFPVRRTNRGPEASQKASPNRSDGHHIPGKRRRGHTHMLPPPRDSHVRCSECEQSSLRAPRSPLGVPRTAPHHGGARSPAPASPAHPIRLLDEAVNVQESKSCCIETLAQSRSHFLYQLISQLVILFAFCAQALAIQRDRSGHLHRARVEPPAIRRYQPRPSEHLAAAQSLNRQAAVTRSNDFERNFSFADEIEGVGFFAFLKDELTGVESDVRRTSDYQLMITRVHPAKERMLSQNAFKRLHCVFLSGYAGPGWARALCVLGVVPLRPRC